MKSDSSPQKGHTPQPYPTTRLTRNRQAVLNILKQEAHPLSAQELYGVLREQQAIGLATIYRALETLKLHGFVQSRVGGNGESLYSPVAKDQHYLTCLNCRRSFPLDHCPVEASEMHLQPAMPFRIYYHTLEFFGLCNPCTHQIE